MGLRLFLLAALLACLSAQAQNTEPPPSSPPDLQTTQDWNRRLEQLVQSASGSAEARPRPVPQEYRIGPDDLLEISVFEAPELNRQLRVSASGEISLPLLGPVQAAGLTPRELEFVLQELLRRTYMRDPHVGVYVREMESHPVSIFGAVRKPGVYQIRGARTLLEVLSMAEGLADDAGDTVVVMRGATFHSLSRPEEAAPPAADAEPPPPAATPAAELPTEAPAADTETLEVSLKSLLQSGDPQHNVTVYPGDIVKVARAGIVYVVGDVRKPGGFVLAHNENISVLQALALAEGLTRTSAKGDARIIRTDPETGARSEIPIDLGRMLSGKASDPLLQARDIVYVPNSATRTAVIRASEAAISIVSGILIWRQ